MLPQEFIRKKRDGLPLDLKAIVEFVQGITDNSVSEGQVAAFAMAVFFQGLNWQERADLTIAMRDSGDVLKWDDLNLSGPVLDKHSSGGVGDKVSLMLAPIVAAAGGFVPMISGRGLGHTGGTMDKLNSIPGYNVLPDIALFRQTVKQVGCAIIGQTGTLAPADKRFYGIRDVTATVESVPLITASILSKKLAAGLDGLVMDIKIGNGAFCDTLDMARELSQSIVTVAGQIGLPTTALVTDMNQVLGRTAGNALEVLETVEYLTRPATRDLRLHEVVIALAAEMILSGKLADEIAVATDLAEKVLENGQAAEYFARMVTHLGGPADFMEKPEAYLPKAPYLGTVLASQSGYVTGMNARDLGLVVVTLKGGRRRADDKIDYSVGLDEVVQTGDQVSVGQPLAIVSALSEDDLEQARGMISAAISIGPEQHTPTSIIIERVG